MITKNVKPNYLSIYVLNYRYINRHLNRSEVVFNLQENPWYIHKNRYRQLRQNI